MTPNWAPSIAKKNLSLRAWWRSAERLLLRTLFQEEDGIRDYKVTGVQTCALPIRFFFQAEDGIRDYKVTGVQTCALPISMIAPSAKADESNRKTVVTFSN